MLNFTGATGQLNSIPYSFHHGNCVVFWVFWFQLSCSCSQMLQLSKDSRRLCANGLIWDCSTDRCVPFPSSTSGACTTRVCASLDKKSHNRLTTFTPFRLDFPLNSWMPDCEIDVESCDCLPPLAPTPQPRLSHRCQLNSSVCAHRHQRFDQVSCRQ